MKGACAQVSFSSRLFFCCRIACAGVAAIAICVTAAAKERSACRSPLRCERIAGLLGTSTVAQLKMAYATACHADPERMALAIRMKELKAPGADQAILRAIPRRYNDYFVAWLIDSGEAYESDQADSPGGQPMCRNPGHGQKAINLRQYWWELLIPVVARHPHYIPKAIALYEFFGNDNPPVDEAEGFPGLIRRLYRTNPSAFCNSLKDSFWGKDALLVAMTTDDEEWDLTRQQEAKILAAHKCGKFGLHESSK